MKEEILKNLNKKTAVSGEELSKKLGISRTAVWKNIQTLKKRGYKITSIPRKGYILEETPDLLLPALITKNLNTELIGKKIYHFNHLASTNDKAKEIAEKDFLEGSVIIAEKQMQGRGRLGRTWESPDGGVWLSVVLCPEILPAKAQLITLTAANAVAKTLRDFDIPVGIKWPNDLLLEGKKVCGILTELKAELDRINYIVLGIGINVNTKKESYPSELQNIISSLKNFSGRDINRVELVSAVLNNIESEYNVLLNKGSREIIDNWKKYNITLNKSVKITGNKDIFTGIAVDLDENGGLIVKDENSKLSTFYSGEVSLQTPKKITLNK